MLDSNNSKKQEMNKQERREKLAGKRAESLLGGGPKRIEAQHAKGKLTARERLEYFLDKNWIDIRRISKLNDQLMTIHNPPLKRKHTGFIKRVKLALHYFFLDTYFFELITILLIFLLDELFVIIIFLTIVVKKVTRYRLYKLRKNLFLNSDNYQIY